MSTRSQHAAGPRDPRRRVLDADRGSTTAETAIVLPVVVMMVLVILVAGVGIGIHVDLESAARAAAREMARGQSEAEAVQVARPWVRVQVTRELRAGYGPLSGAGWQLEATATARREPHLIQARAAPGSAP
jgi:hypothetical protein